MEIHQQMWFSTKKDGDSKSKTSNTGAASFNNK
jgi:hypothetical protein